MDYDEDDDSDDEEYELAPETGPFKSSSSNVPTVISLFNQLG